MRVYSRAAVQLRPGDVILSRRNARLRVDRVLRLGEPVPWRGGPTVFRYLDHPGERVQVWATPLNARGSQVSRDIGIYAAADTLEVVVEDAGVHR